MNNRKPCYGSILSDVQAPLGVEKRAGTVFSTARQSRGLTAAPIELHAECEAWEACLKPSGSDAGSSQLFKRSNATQAYPRCAANGALR